MDNLTELYCHIDDFYQFKPEFDAHLIATGHQRLRACQISVAEIMTILVLFHQRRYRQFKSFYYHHMHGMMKQEFPNLPSYSRFIKLMPRSIMPLCAYLQSMMGDCTGISYIDSTKIAVCHNKRIYRHKVFKGLATRGKSSMAGFTGFKLHAIINHKGELVSVKVTAGNTDDRVPVKDMATPVFGKVFGDRGYISKALNEWLTKHSDTRLITKLRRNMKPQVLKPIDEALLNHRSLVETVFGELKNLCQIEHSRHRSVTGFITNLLSGLIAYRWFPYKPTIKNMPQQGQVATL
ncbi:LOW QUALITY PROTEIN: mobile element protein [Psychrobacter sp. JCM 18902]|nr:LOW QUALITY PROTEIN: mobile element protein [Psychrobacter sp. JCM 18902]